MKKVAILIGVAFSVTIVAIFFIYRGDGQKEYDWRIVPVEKGDITVLVTATGSMAADTSVDVGVQVSGIIAEIKTDFNQQVKKGQVIAILDTTMYYAAKLDASAAVQRAQAAFDESKREYDRSKNLFDNKVAAQADYDLALTAYQNAKGNLTSAKAQLYKAAINLQYCTITAPISGVVIARNVQIGNMVIASFNSPVLFTIANDLHKMQVQANVDEADIGQVKDGQQVKFTVDAFPSDVFSATITQVRKQPIIVTNVVNYVVIAEVINPDLKLVPGLTANLNIYIEQRTGVLKVPSNSFTFTPPEEYIQGDALLADSVQKKWIKKIHQNGQLRKQEITKPLGEVGFLWVKRGNDIFPLEIIKGLSDGTFTEVGGAIKEDNEVVVGINQSSSAAKQNQSPFMPKFPSSKKK